MNANQRPTPTMCNNGEAIDGADVLPDHDSCRKSSPSDFPPGWIVCPSRSRPGECSYYCPGSGSTVEEVPNGRGCNLAEGLEPTPAVCFDPTRGDAAHFSQPFLPTKPRSANQDKFELVESCKINEKMEWNNWVRCPSRTRPRECSYYCLPTKRTFYCPPEQDLNQCLPPSVCPQPSPEQQSKTSFVKTTKQSICTQVDFQHPE